MSSTPPEVERPTTNAQERASLAEVPPRTSPGMLLLSAVLPGAGHLARGEWVKGMWLLIPWGVLLGVLYLTWGRVEEALAAPVTPVDIVIAVATLVLLMLGIWGWAMYDWPCAPTGRRS